MNSRPTPKPVLAIAVSLIALTSLVFLPEGSATTSPTCQGFLGGTAIQSGCEAWATTTDLGEDGPFGIATSPDGTILYIFSGGTNETRTAFVHLNAFSSTTGEPLWTTSWREGAINGARMMTVSPDGARVYLVGTINNGATSQMYALAYDARNGRLEWSILGPDHSDGYAIKTSPDSSVVYIAGMYRRNTMLYAVNAASAEQLWGATYDGQGGPTDRWQGKSYDALFDIAPSADGRTVYVTGTSDSASGILEQATFAYDATTGAIQWISREHAVDALGNAKHTEGYILALAPDGSRVYAHGTGGTFALDSETGARQWTATAARCRSTAPVSRTSECALAVGSPRVFAFGYNDVAAYDETTGEVVWHLPLHVGSDTNALRKGMVLSHDGTRLYLATSGGVEHLTDSASSIQWNYITRGLDAATGKLLWRTSYGNGDEGVYGITIAPDGDRVFVTGNRWTHGKLHPDLVTVAYDTRLGIENAPNPAL